MARVVARRVRQQYWPPWASLLWLSVGGLLLLTIAACRPGTPVVDVAPQPAEALGTISGTVRGPLSTSAIEGRIVQVVNVETNERQRTMTNSAGGFTFKVKPGKYRLELTLREDESLVKSPGVMEVNRSDVDAHADFVIGSTRASRPRSPGFRIDHGLGQPVA